MGSFSILSVAKELIISSVVKFSFEAPSLSFEAKPENLTDEIISSFAPERIEKEPIFLKFMAIPEKNQLQVSRENVFATKTHHESEEVSTELFDYGSCITKKRKAIKNLGNLFVIYNSLMSFYFFIFHFDEGSNIATSYATSAVHLGT